ncbi:acyltransferase family protein [Flavobacterium piscinae]|nr:acyltransferase family protein [Flavobacterium piscinae]
MRKHYLDYIRTFALMGVIVIHVSSVEIRKFDINSNHWLIAHFFDSISRVSVPLFFMLSGVFSFKTKVNNKNFIITRLKRLVIPLLFWASIYTIWNLIISDRNYTMLGIIKK